MSERDLWRNGFFALNVVLGGRNGGGVLQQGGPHCMGDLTMFQKDVVLEGRHVLGEVRTVGTHLGFELLFFHDYRDYIYSASDNRGGGGDEERKEEVNTDQKRFHLPTENGRKLLLWRRREEGKTKFGEEQRQ